MANIKRDYIITLDISKAGHRGSIKLDRNIFFYASERDTRNIFLIIKGTNLDDVNVSMLIADNNGIEVARLKGKRHEPSIVEYDIPNDLEVGNYKAAFLVQDATLNKILTSDPFEFKIKENLFME